jgi:hypothetical protein
MRLSFKTRVVLLLTLLLITCQRSEKPEVVSVAYDRNEFFNVDYSMILENQVDLRLSEIADSIYYIVMETDSGNLFHNLAEPFFTEKYIFIDNVYHILMFSRNGRFIRSIGKKGRGPGEIDIIRQMSVLDSLETIIVQLNWVRKLYFFSYEGEFMKSTPVPDLDKIIVMPDGRRLYYTDPAYGFEKSVFALTKENGDTCSMVRNHFFWNTKGYTLVAGYHLFKHFYSCSSTLHMKSMYNDTVYCIRGDSIVPEYFIDLGAYKLPQELRPEVRLGGFDLFLEEASGYRFATSFESGDRLFITSQDYSDKEAELKWNMIYNRHLNNGLLVTDQSSNPSAILNDIDGGADFWPVGAINDSTVYMLIPSFKLSGSENRKKYSDKQALDQTKNADFIRMAKSIGEADNPVIMVVRLKKRGETNGRSD